MNLFDALIINNILLMFPIILWLFYVLYIKNSGREVNDLLFDFSLVTSLYLLIKFGVSVIGVNIFLIVNIPLFIAYLKKRLRAILFLSLMLVIYYNCVFSFNIFLLILEYIFYFFIYKVFLNKERIYLFIFSVLKCIIFFYYIISFNNLNLLIVSFLAIIGTLIISFIIIIICLKTEDLINYHLSLKKLEEDKQFRTTLFKITHEIKNPIAVCKGYLDMFDVDNIKHSQKYVPILKMEIERTLILLQDFLNMTKIEMEKTVLDIQLILEDVLDASLPFLRVKGVKCELNLLEEDCYIIGDYNRLSQVFINIIKNAIEAVSKNEGIVIINVKKLAQKIEIEIRDNGVGLSKEQLDKIGEAFFTTKSSGTGLGIYLSQEIIKGHNGSIKYKSVVNKGTSVIVILPLKKE